MPVKKLLLHTCCAPCGGFLAQEFLTNYELTIYFSNSNIYPKSEYQHRLEEIRQYFKTQKINFILAEYNHESWLEFIRGLEKEPERGKRCEQCYLYRLEHTVKYASDNGYDIFASTLAISPHKDAEKLNQIGKDLAKKYDVEFLAGDWKKQDGFKKAMVLSHKEGFYHQDYCGCEFSIRG